MVDNVTLTDLHKATKVGTCFEAFVDQVPSQKIQDDINTLT